MKRGAPYCTRAGWIDQVGEVNDMIRSAVSIVLPNGIETEHEALRASYSQRWPTGYTVRQGIRGRTTSPVPSTS
jgi:hypothetical protein